MTDSERYVTTVSGLYIRKLMTAYGWTIRSFAKAHDLTLARVREVRDHGLCRSTVPSTEMLAGYVRDWQELICGADPRKQARRHSNTTPAPSLVSWRGANYDVRHAL